VVIYCCLKINNLRLKTVSYDFIMVSVREVIAEVKSLSYDTNREFRYFTTLID